MNSKLAGRCADDERSTNQATHRPTRGSTDFKDSPGMETNMTLQIKQKKRKGGRNHSKISPDKDKISSRKEVMLRAAEHQRPKEEGRRISPAHVLGNISNSGGVALGMGISKSPLSQLLMNFITFSLLLKMKWLAPTMLITFFCAAFLVFHYLNMY